MSRSSCVFHYIREGETPEGGLGVLQNILRVGFYPRYHEEVVRSNRRNHTIGIPMVCFCDIPISRVQKHVKKYGPFAIGLTQDWAIRKKLNPIAYLVRNSIYEESIDAVFEVFEKLPYETEERRRAYIRMMGFTKAYEGPTAIFYNPYSGNSEPEYVGETEKFYDECEWRYIPILSGDDPKHVIFEREMPNFQGFADSHGKRLETDYRLEFEASDVAHLIVKTDDDTLKMCEFLLEQNNRFSAIEQKLLVTKVVSLESISRDY